MEDKKRMVVILDKKLKKLIEKETNKQMKEYWKNFWDDLGEPMEKFIIHGDLD